MNAAELKKRQKKTYNSGYSLVVTHLTTNPPVRCLNRAERTGSLVFNVLWSYVKEWKYIFVYEASVYEQPRFVRAAILTDIDLCER